MPYVFGYFSSCLCPAVIVFRMQALPYCYPQCFTFHIGTVSNSFRGACWWCAVVFARILVMCLSFRVLAILNFHVTMYLFCSACSHKHAKHLRGHGTLGESWVGVMRTVLSAEAPERQSTFPGTVTVRPRDVLVCIVCVRAVFIYELFQRTFKKYFQKTFSRISLENCRT